MTILRGPWPKTQEEARVQRQFQDIVDAELRDALRTRQDETDAEIRERVRLWKLKRWGKARMYWLIFIAGLMTIACLGMK